MTDASSGPFRGLVELETEKLYAGLEKEKARRVYAEACRERAESERDAAEERANVVTAVAAGAAFVLLLALFAGGTSGPRRVDVSHYPGGWVQTVTRAPMVGSRHMPMWRDADGLHEGAALEPGECAIAYSLHPVTNEPREMHTRIASGSRCDVHEGEWVCFVDERVCANWGRGEEQRAAAGSADEGGGR